MDYISYVDWEILLNRPVTKEEILRAEDVLGPNIGSLKGKTTCKTPEKVILNTSNNLPQDF